MVQKRSIKTDDVRTEDYMALSDKAVRVLLDLKTNGTDSYGFITNVALSLLVCSHAGSEMQQCKDALEELVQTGYLYDFGGGIYLVMSFQRDNALEYLKTTQPTAPELLTHVYVDVNTNMYKLSAVPVRSKDGWTGKLKTNQGKDYQGKDNVPPRKYLFEDNIEDGYSIVPFDTKLDWSQHEAVAKGVNVTEPQQAPSNPAQYTVSTPAREVAPKQEVKPVPVQSNFDIKSKIANVKSIEQEENTPVQPVGNPYTDTAKQQQEVEQLKKKYGVDSQTRSMPVQTEEDEDTSLPFGNDEDTQAGLSREEQNTQPLDYSPADTSDLPFPD